MNFQLSVLEQVYQAALVFVLLFYIDDVRRYARRLFGTTWIVGYLYSLLVLIGIRVSDTPVSDLYDLYEFLWFVFGVFAVYVIHLKPFMKSVDMQRSLVGSTAFLFGVLFIGKIFNVFLYVGIGVVGFLYSLQYVSLSGD